MMTTLALAGLGAAITALGLALARTDDGGAATGPTAPPSPRRGARTRPHVPAPPAWTDPETTPEPDTPWRDPETPGAA